MRSFLVSSSGFVLVAAAIFVGLAHVSDGVAPVFRVEAAQVRIWERRASAEVVSCGSSHGQGLDYEAMGVSGVHLWTVGQDVFETEALLEAWLDRFPDAHTVILPVSALTFALDNGLEMPGGLDVPGSRSLLRRRIYRLLPPAEIVRGDTTNLIAARTAEVVREDHWAPVFLQLVRGRFRPRPTERLVSADGDVIFRVGPATRLRLQRLARQHAEQTIALARSMLAADPELPEEAYAAFVRCVERIRERGLRLVLFRTPLHASYLPYLDDPTFALADPFVERLEREHGLVVHDFTHDPLLQDDATAFTDPTHLSPAGAATFSRERLAPLVRPPGSD